MTESLHEELFVEPKGSLSLKLIAAIAALLITVLVFAGYAYLRQRHAEKGGLGATSQPVSPEPRKPPKAQIFVDDAMLQDGKTVIGGTVRNTSNERLEGVSVELELKRRKDGTAEKKLVALEPSQLEPEQEGRYSLHLKAQEYGSVRLITLRAGPNSLPLPYTTAQGKKRPPERLETKTITVDKRSSKRDGFLNSPDNPARVP